MRKLICLFGLVCSFGTVGFCQSVTNQNSGISYPRDITPYAIINQSTGDTVSWFWNRAEVQSYVSGLGLNTTANTKVLINDSLVANSQGFAYSSSISAVHIYTFASTPLNHISAPKYSICITADTGIYIKVLGIDSAGWFKAR